MNRLRIMLALIFAITACNPVTPDPSIDRFGPPVHTCNESLVIQGIWITDDGQHSHPDTVVTSTLNGATYTLQYGQDWPGMGSYYPFSPEDYNDPGRALITVNETGYAEQTRTLQKVVNGTPCLAVDVQGETSFNLIPE